MFLFTFKKMFTKWHHAHEICIHFKFLWKKEFSAFQKIYTAFKIVAKGKVDH